jgi:hypothetical protein
MPITKGELVALAQREITKIDGEIFNTNAFDKNIALKTLEYLAGSLTADGIQIGWIEAANPEDVYWDDESGVSIVNALNLAKYLSSHIYPANNVHPLILGMSKEGKEKLYPVENTPTMGNPLMPSGQGNRGWYWNNQFLDVEQPIDVESDSVITT